MTADIVDARGPWMAYIAAIRTHARGSMQGRPNLDAIMQAVVEENLRWVQTALRQRSPPGVVTKIKLPFKANSAALWRAFDERLRQRAAQSRPGYKPMPLPMQATKDPFQRYDADAFLQADGKYARTRNADVHHIWPETLGGPTVGWNVVPLPPFQHHDILHPILDRIVRESEEGQRFRLL